MSWSQFAACNIFSLFKFNKRNKFFFFIDNDVWDISLETWSVALLIHFKSTIFFFVGLHRISLFWLRRNHKSLQCHYDLIVFYFICYYQNQWIFFRIHSFCCFELIAMNWLLCLRYEFIYMCVYIQYEAMRVNENDRVTNTITIAIFYPRQTEDTQTKDKSTYTHTQKKNSLG